VYVAIDPGDRSAAWRVELSDRLREALGADAEGRAGRPLRATAERAQAPFAGPGPPPQGRGQIGFLGHEFALAGALHGLNALALFAVALHTGRRIRTAAPKGVAAPEELVTTSV
jgi:hypothetical protein